jgi:membrane-bound lytic murein transglycosylase B
MVLFMHPIPRLFSTHACGIALVAGCLLLASPAQVSAAEPKKPVHVLSPSKAKAKNKAPNKDKTQNKASTEQATPTGPVYAGREDARLWTQDAAKRLDLPADWLQKQIDQARRIMVIEKLIMPPATPAAKNWAAYRARFIESQRIQAGARFWRTHKATLEKAEREFGVPAAIVVGILGIETLYGQNTGNFRVLDALATLTFDFPSKHPRAVERQAFFKSELEQFLLLTSRSGADPLSVKGSFAGAMGLPQFMPSSWARYAIDFDGDGRIDLFGSPADVIGSVANYFKAFQWQPGMPTHYPVDLVPGQTDMDALMAPDILPTFSVSSFTAKGARLEGAALNHTGPLALIELRNGLDAPSYVAGTENFYAITRYNWSSYYAMSVIELAEAVAREVKNKP